MPVCPRFRAALVDPEAVDFDHGRLLPDPLQKHAVGLLNSLQLRVRLEAEPLAESFGDDNAPGFINPELHTIKHTKYH